MGCGFATSWQGCDYSAAGKWYFALPAFLAATASSKDLKEPRKIALPDK
jgi:hypothetical protein